MVQPEENSSCPIRNDVAADRVDGDRNGQWSQVAARHGGTINELIRVDEDSPETFRADGCNAGALGLLFANGVLSLADPATGGFSETRTAPAPWPSLPVGDPGS